jgi:hypothetical protein
MRIPWRKQPERDERAQGSAAMGGDARSPLECRLRERGVTDADARSLAERLAWEWQQRGRGARTAFVDGIAAGWHASSETRARLDRTVSDIKEVERLMGAFTGELSKLDEVLEVLAAYVRRMRTSKAESSQGQTLH